MKQVEYYKNGNRTLRIKYEGIKKLLEKKCNEIERLDKNRNDTLEFIERYLKLDLDAFNTKSLLIKIVEILTR